MTKIKITRDIASQVLKVVDAGLSSGVGVREPGQMCVEAAVCYALGLPHGDDPGCVAPSLRSLKMTLNDAEWSSKQARAAGLRRLALVQLGSMGNLDEEEFVRRLVDHAIRKSTPSALRFAASSIKDEYHRNALLTAAEGCEIEGASALKEANMAAAAASSASSASSAAYAAYAATAAYAAATAAYASYAADAANAATAARASSAAAYATAYASYAAETAAYAASSARTAGSDKYLEEYAEAVVQILIELGVPGVQWLDLAPVQP